MFDRGHGRKSKAGDARTVAVVALRTAGLMQVQTDGEQVALRLLAGRDATSLAGAPCRLPPSRVPRTGKTRSAGSPDRPQQGLHTRLHDG
jgi:hypothetical protein